MIQRRLTRDIGAADGDGRHQFDFMLQVFGLGRIGNGGAVGHQRIRWLAEEERQLAVGICTHLTGVIGIVAADTENPPHRKQSFVVFDSDGCLFGWRDDVSIGRGHFGLVVAAQHDGKAPKVHKTCRLRAAHLRSGHQKPKGKYMRRRELFRAALASTAVATVLSKKEAVAQEASARAARGMAMPKIKDLQVIECAPKGSRLTVVKVVTDQDGLYGYGCATFTQRADLVKPAVELYLKPLLVGRTVDRIEDIWQMAYDSSYWKNGPVENNAISGVDQALWDIKGRMAGMPVYQLLGGKAREAVDLYGHAEGAEIQETIDDAKKYIAQGFRHVRIQVGLPGMAGYGARQAGARFPSIHNEPVFEREAAKRRALALFEAAREQLGGEVELSP